MVQTNPGRLTSGADIRLVFATPLVAHGSAMVVRARSRADAEPPRAAVVAGRRVGNAVVRNRAKRRLRAALQHASVPPGMDLVVVARHQAVAEPFDRLQSQLDRLVARVSSNEKVSDDG